MAIDLGYIRWAGVRNFDAFPVKDFMEFVWFFAIFVN